MVSSVEPASGMWAADNASRALGMSIVSLEVGSAQTSMVVRPDMVNGYNICHGGIVAALADSAFALACNTHGESAVATGFEIDFVSPTKLGEVVVATATERWRNGRSGIYDVTVRASDRVVAEFRGRSRVIKVEPGRQTP